MANFSKKGLISNKNRNTDFEIVLDLEWKCLKWARGTSEFRKFQKSKKKIRGDIRKIPFLNKNEKILAKIDTLISKFVRSLEWKFSKWASS